MSALVWALAPLASALSGPGEVKVTNEAPATGTHLNPPVANNSPMLAADPSEPRFVALANRIDAPDFSCALQVSGDEGRSWIPAVPVRELPPGVDRCYAPEIAFGPGGTLYYLFVGLAGDGNEPVGAFLVESDDRGASFTPPRQVLGALNFSVRLAIDRTLGEQGRMHLVWLHATSDPPLGGFAPPPNPIMAAYSDDGGNTFSEPVQISESERLRVVAPALALGPDHAVHVAYYDLHNDVRDYQGLEGPVWPGTWSLVASSSYDGGESFGAGVVVTDDIVPPGRVILIFTMPPPALAAGDGAVYAGWHDQRNGDWDVFVGPSEDGGRTWGEPLRLNDDPLGNGRHQYLPELSIAPGGRLDAVFYDRRNDTQNLYNDVFYTYSSDGARRFAPNIKLSSQSGHSQIGQRYLVPSAEDMFEFGSHPALLAGRASALAAWTDTRNASLGTTQQDVFTAIASHPEDEADSAAGQAEAVAGVAALVLGVGVVSIIRRHRRHRSALTSPAGLGAEKTL